MPVATTLAAVDVHGLRLPSGSVTFHRQDPILGHVDIRLDATGDQHMLIHLSCAFDGADRIPRLREYIRELIDNIVAEIAYVSDFACGTIATIQDDFDTASLTHTTPRVTVEVSEVGQAMVGSADTIRASVRPVEFRVVRELIVSAEAEPRLAERLAAAVAHPYKDTYAEILRTTDPIGRFILLYGFLTFLVGGEAGRQSTVDTWLAKTRSDIQVSVHTDTRGRSRRETVFTRLRNEIAHGLESRHTPDLKETRQRVHSAVRHLQTVVKEAIDESLERRTQSHSV